MDKLSIIKIEECFLQKIIESSQLNMKSYFLNLNLKQVI